MDTRKDIDADFRDPPARYRSLPFWAWNDRLDKDELAAQIRSMKEQGTGGFFMHSRDGLETPYLEAEWMDCVRASVRTAEAEGLKAWLYDEDRWPSGSAGGKVCGLGDAFRAKALTMEILEGDYRPAGGEIALFLARIGEVEYHGGERIDCGLPRAAEAGGVFLVFRIEIAAGDEWFNGEAPPDNLNPGTVEKFIELNYEPYRAAFGSDFGKTISGIFTDEPSVHDRHCRYTPGRGWIPWTLLFAEYFRSKRGYDPLDSIPLVFFDGKGQDGIRHDYWRTVSDLFCEAYTEQLARWCSESGLLFTGHYLWENQLGTATRVGGAVMPHYRWQDVPGIDLLCEQIDETITVKQCTSVANQYGRKNVLSEMYGCVGWEFSFEGQKWIGDWQFVMGVTVRCQHLALYSLKGCRKRDYPPVFNYNTSWWKYDKVVEDYFARLSAVLTRGEVVRDILVLHPASSAWSLLASNPRGFQDRGADRNIGELNAYGDDFDRFLRHLLGAHHDFDLGDETIMAEAGRVVTGDDGSAALFVNLASYRVVVIPPVRSLLRSTRELLHSFLEAGGKVVAVSPFPTMLEGREAEELAALFRHRNLRAVEGREGVVPVLQSLSPRNVSLMGPRLVEDDDLLCMLRREGELAYLFIVNTDRSGGHEIVVSVEGVGAVRELDPLTGIMAEIGSESSGGRTRFHAHFGPAGSRLYRLDFGREPAVRAKADFDAKPNLLASRPILGALGPTASFSRTEPNALVLDRCAFTLGDSSWSAEMETWRAQREIRGILGMRQIHYNGLEQRYRWTGEAHQGDGAPVRFRYFFDVKRIPDGNVHLVLESPADYRIALNGAEMTGTSDGWFLDKSFEKIPLRGLVHGRNELVLSCAYRNRMEAEDCFLIGDFAVDADRALAAEPAALRFGDWCLQGYPHYCGSMVYRFDLPWTGAGNGAGKAILELGDFFAVTVAIRVNGTAAGFVPWRSAGGVDISGCLRSPSNLVEIEVMGSPRNLLGPFHNARGSVPFNDWSAFRSEGADYTPGYVLHPYGLFGQVVLRGE